MRLLRILFLLVILAALVTAPAQAQTPAPNPEITSILNSMTPEERVGQLFLVTFNGADTSETSQIYNLVTQYHIGGVVLLAGNDNFAAAPDTAAQAQLLINNIQQVEWDISRNSVTGEVGEAGADSVYVPLFVGIAQEGNGYPTDQILSGLTPLPSEMAIGATWNTELARQVGEVRGSDRLPEEEVSTVRKSIEQLKQIELAPFFAVTGNAGVPESTVDGLLVSHIRYQGFQGNIRATTRPISFDPQALSQILALPQFTEWKSAGGLIISDDLGTRAVSEFYATGGGQFSPRIAARDAFLAGNDMLYLGNIISSDTSDSYAATTRVVEFFAQKYREDPAFAQRVDASVARILAVKLGLYENLTLSNVIAPASALDNLGTATEAAFDVARNSATLISADKQYLAAVISLPPQSNESMVFITDTLNVKQCAACVEQPTLAIDALQQTVLQLYGPQSGNQTANFRLSSYSFQNLQSLMDAQEVAFIEDDIKTADWIIISLADAAQGQPALISRFLRERPDLSRDKRVILFSFGAPYYFDTTTISKFTAYYALYSKQPQFVDVAARLLFQELTPVGDSPVSISAVGYDLISVMSPNPDQIIPLFLDLEPVPVVAGDASTPEATPIPLFRIGDTIAIRTGVILDNNGHSVPDGTVVQFSMMLTGEGGGILKQVDAVTTQGVAHAAFGLDKPGLLEIHVTSEPAVISEVLQLDVSQSGAVAVTVVVPELTQLIEPTPEATVVVEEDEYISAEGYPRFSAWLVAMLFITFSILVGYGVGIRITSRRAAFRWALSIALGGLAAYNYLILGLFGIVNWLTASGLPGAITFVLMGELIGFVGGWFWSKRLLK